MAKALALPFPVVAVVEDDAPLRQAIGFSLTVEGYPVRGYGSAEDLLASDGLDEIGCFVIDQALPKANGLDLLKKLRKRSVPGRAVLITTRPPPGLRTACASLGVPIVEKPLLGESLNACIRGLLARPASC